MPIGPQKSRAMPRKGPLPTKSSARIENQKRSRIGTSRHPGTIRKARPPVWLREETGGLSLWVSRRTGVRPVGFTAEMVKTELPAGYGLGREGIVSKRLGSPYRSGRSPDWLKFKNPAGACGAAGGGGGLGPMMEHSSRARSQSRSGSRSPACAKSMMAFAIASRGGSTTPRQCKAWMAVSNAMPMRRVVSASNL